MTHIDDRSCRLHLRNERRVHEVVRLRGEVDADQQQVGLARELLDRLGGLDRTVRRRDGADEIRRALARLAVDVDELARLIRLQQLERVLADPTETEHADRSASPASSFSERTGIATYSDLPRCARTESPELSQSPDVTSLIAGLTSRIAMWTRSAAV